MTTEQATIITVREATPGDAGAIARLQSEMDDLNFDESGFDGLAMREILLDMTGYPFFRAYLATDEEGRPVGTFSLLVFHSPSHQGTKQAMLDAVVVTRTSRGRGIGIAMIERALQIAGDAGCYKVMLSSNLKRMDAHRFYESIGFTQHGVGFSILLSR